VIYFDLIDNYFAVKSVSTQVTFKPMSNSLSYLNWIIDSILIYVIESRIKWIEARPADLFHWVSMVEVKDW